MFKFEKTDNGYMASVVERVVAERNKEVDSFILGEIREIAIDNEIETKIILNEKNVAEALRNYQDGYKSIKAEVVREIFEEIDEIFVDYKIDRCLEKCGLRLLVSNGEGIEQRFAELKKKYTEGE